MSGRSGTGTASATGGGSASPVALGLPFVDGSFSTAPREKVRPHPPARNYSSPFGPYTDFRYPMLPALWSGLWTGTMAKAMPSGAFGPRRNGATIPQETWDRAEVPEAPWPFSAHPFAAAPLPFGEP